MLSLRLGSERRTLPPRTHPRDSSTVLKERGFPGTAHEWALKITAKDTLCLTKLSRAMRGVTPGTEARMERKPSAGDSSTAGLDLGSDTCQICGLRQVSQPA